MCKCLGRSGNRLRLGCAKTNTAIATSLSDTFEITQEPCRFLVHERRCNLLFLNRIQWYLLMYWLRSTDFAGLVEHYSGNVLLKNVNDVLFDTEIAQGNVIFPVTFNNQIPVRGAHT